MDRELLSIKKAAARAGVGQTTIYRWLRLGRLDFVRTAGGAIRIYADTLFQPATSLDAIKRVVEAGQRPWYQSDGEPPVNLQEMRADIYRANQAAKLRRGVA